MMKHFILLAFFSVFIYSCIEQKKTSPLHFNETYPSPSSVETEQSEENETTDELEDKVTFELIQTTILQPFNCVGCHSDWATSETALKTKFTSGDALSSPFFLRVQDGSMPFGGPIVDLEKLELIEKYINEFKNE